MLQLPHSARRPALPLGAFARAVLLAALLVAPAAFAAAPAAEAGVPARPGLYRQWYDQKAGSQVLRRPYLLYLPAGYAAAPAARQPLLVFLHGVGERGNNFARLDSQGPLRHVQDDAKFAQNLPLMVISPQCPNDSD